MTDQISEGHVDEQGSTPTSWARFCAIGCFTVVILTCMAGMSDGFATVYTPLAMMLAVSQVFVIAFGATALYWYTMAWLRNDPMFSIENTTCQ